jgi:organic hydroperoxide reductase OsmC/OhrA
MTSSMTVQLRSIPDTNAAIGMAGSHSIVVDRPDGKAGGMGLGFNGGQLLGLAIGGCFCNDLHYVAHDAGIHLKAVEVEVIVEFDGSPLIATRATMRAKVTALDESVDTEDIIKRANEVSTVSNSIKRGIIVDVLPR